SCATDGQANPVATCAAVRNRLVSSGSGVKLLENTLATGIVNGTGKYTLVQTSSGTTRAANVIVAAGPWTNDLLSPHGITLPLAIRRPHMAETEPLPDFYGGFIGMGTVRGYGYGRQTAS